MDIRIASSEAKFGFVFARRGLVPEAGSAWFLPRLVGLNQALRWCLSGRVFGADEAQGGGLVTEVVAPDSCWRAPARSRLEIAENTAPVSLALTRARCCGVIPAQPHPFELMKIDGALSVELGAGPDVKEGVAAFLEKRKPNFPGKVSTDMPPRYKPRDRARGVGPSRARSLTRHGLVLRSQPKVDIWPWPGTNCMSSPSGQSRAVIESTSCW